MQSARGQNSEDGQYFGTCRSNVLREAGISPPVGGGGALGNGQWRCRCGRPVAAPDDTPCRIGLSAERLDAPMKSAKPTFSAVGAK